jgi:ubiquinone/menaquinone biosynthesis C-methylase UbiE
MASNPIFFGLSMKASVKHAEKFWDRMAKRYAQRPISDTKTFEKKLKIITSYMYPSVRVLELGCGTGTVALRLAEHAGHIQALDVSSAMLKIAREKAQDQGVENVTFEHRDVVAMPLEENSQDMVVALSVLHLLPHKRAVLDKLYEALIPGGVLVSNTFCLASEPWWLRGAVKCLTAIGLLPRINYFTTQELLEEFEEVGFEVAHNWQPEGSRAHFTVLRKPTE